MKFVEMQEASLMPMTSSILLYRMTLAGTSVASSCWPTSWKFAASWGRQWQHEIDLFLLDTLSFQLHPFT
jgi:aminopeptidase C